jgi:hypothetical protein
LLDPLLILCSSSAAGLQVVCMAADVLQKKRKGTAQSQAGKEE